MNDEDMVMSRANTVLILGAYGLAGRTIFDGLLRKTALNIIVAGRRREKLQALVGGAGSRVELLTLDAADREVLSKACAGAGLTINAVGPYAVHGAEIARTVIDNGCSYLDCANEQVHYRRLQEIDVAARNKGLLLATAAGVIPGLSSLIAAKLLEGATAARTVEIFFAQFQHAYEDSGFASIMGGVLDAGYRPVAWVDGREAPVSLGDSRKTEEFPPPFGRRRCLEAPTIDALTLPARFAVQTQRTWFYLGEQPTWVFSLIRLLQPHKRKWAYRLIEELARPMNTIESRRARRSKLSREALLAVTVRGDGADRLGRIVLKDGAAPMNSLPVRIAQQLLAGKLKHVGLATPLDLMTFDQLNNDLDDFAVETMIR